MIKMCIDLFCQSSGQKVSNAKTRIFFSKNVHWNTRTQISDVLGFQRTDGLGKYLGVPLIHKKVNQHTFRYVIDKASQRLSSWKARNLSMAGRVTLARSVLQALPNYVMQTAWLPSNICTDLDKHCRSFIWGDEPNRRKIHLTPWHELCEHRSVGGLGMRNTRDMNTTFMMKAGWALCTSHNSLWVRVVKHKYNCGTDLIPHVAEAHSSSNFWRGVCRSWDHVRRSLV